jgi:hypothetical protein
MKIKLVIVDAFPSPTAYEKKFDYKVSETHIDLWVYSPEQSPKTIASEFSVV